MENTCNIALKEWAVTTRALEAGRQIILLRKGGLLDPATEKAESGAFTLEYSNFWLQDTFLHQDQNLVKPENRDLFEKIEAKLLKAERETENSAFGNLAESRNEARRFLRLQTFARVERVWDFGPDDEEKLLRAPHIWSRAYFDIRFSYKPQSPLLCAALRVYRCETPHLVPLRAEFAGCRSWLELGEDLPLKNPRAALNDDEFAAQIAHFEYSIR